MDNFITAINDLIKYQITKYINTGDRQIDTLLVIISLIIMTYITKKFGDVSKLIDYMRWRKIPDGFASTNYDYPSIDNEAFYRLNIQVKTADKRALDLDKLREIFNGQLSNRGKVVFTLSGQELKVLGSEAIAAFYSYRNNIVYGRVSGGNLENIASNDLTAVKMMLEKLTIKSITTDSMSLNEFVGRQINFISRIDNKRTFDRFVSRHKSTFMKFIDRFKSKQNCIYEGFVKDSLGILLYGPPGTGKTSFIKCLCNYFGRNAYIIDFTKIITAKDLINAFNTDTEKSIYVLDEFDYILNSMENDNENNFSKELLNAVALCTDKETRNNLLKEYKISKDFASDKINIRNILTILDGMIEFNDRIIVATTNNIDKISPALLRPGRFDVKIKLDLFDDGEIKELLTKIFEPNEEDLLFIVSQEFPEYVWSPAEIINSAVALRDLRLLIAHLKNEPN